MNAPSTDTSPRPAGRASRFRGATAVVAHIIRHYSGEISLETAADMASMSRTAFSRNFQTVTGNKFVEFVNRVRVGQACSKLYATDKPISTISHEVGFHTLASFNRQFLRMKDMTPSAYRRTARVGLIEKGRSAP